MNSGDLDVTSRHITRRSFLGTTAAGSAVLLTGGLATLFESAASAAGGFPFVEATIPRALEQGIDHGISGKDSIIQSDASCRD